MFYHWPIRVELPWLDYIFVTPRVHRVYHSVRVEHHNNNFTEVLPIVDIVFGTSARPVREEFPETDLGTEMASPRSLPAAQFAPI